jgi:hypothetical protein
MDFTGKLISMQPLQTGEGKNGPWKKQDIIFEYGDTYPKKVSVSVWGDKIDSSLFVVGNTLQVHFEVESREYNGKWYTDCKAWKMNAAGGGSAPAEDIQQFNSDNFSQDPSDDSGLPF